MLGGNAGEENVMLNIFHYGNNIPPLVRDKLVDREVLCQKAVYDASSLFWDIEQNEGSRQYTLTKKGLIELCLATFSESEIMSLPDDEFRDRIFIQYTDDQRRRESKYIEQRLTDWVNRLNNLFKEIAEWTPSGYDVQSGEVIQRNEVLMQRHGIAPRLVPTITIVRKASHIAFVPSALWIIGADGRVDVITNHGQYILVDRRQRPGMASAWQITTDRKRLVAFDKTVFTALIRRRT